MSQETDGCYSLRVATIEILSVELQSSSADAAPPGVTCRIQIRCKDGSTKLLVSKSDSRESAVANAISELCIKPISVSELELKRERDEVKLVLLVSETNRPKGRRGVGRFVEHHARPVFDDTGLVIATLRAASHAGMLKAAYRANNQKVFRGWSSELMEEMKEILDLSSLSETKRLEAEGLILEHTNRVASAAVITAANYPRPGSILSLFDTSAWLFDSQGRRRDAYTDTDLWLAWYPGIENDHLTVDEVIESMPRATATKIPWIVRLFENPQSWIRFRGAVDLEDHDVMHVLLGRGLQDQDEAFVIGFAMGTAKKVSWLQYWVFKFVLAWFYPEPYRIPRYLQPAFDLGVQCGQATGTRDLYKQQLKELRHLTLGAARERCDIDVHVVREFCELEQQRIPFTIASLRLP